jgi:hypothetical protein
MTRHLRLNHLEIFRQLCFVCHTYLPPVNPFQSVQAGDLNASSTDNQLIILGHKASRAEGEQASRAGGDQAGQSGDERAGQGEAEKAGQSGAEKAGQSRAEKAGQSGDQKAGRAEDRQAGQSGDEKADQSGAEKAGQSRDEWVACSMCDCRFHRSCFPADGCPVCSR